MYLEEADFVLADPTDIERLQAAKTEYVGVLKDGKTRGFQTLVFGVPYRGRAIPFHFITYSSRTIGQEATSPGQSHLNWDYVVRRKALKRHTVLSDLPIICWTIRFV